MAIRVIKRNGERRLFVEAKIRASLELAAQDAGLAEERSAELVEQIFGAVMEVAKEKEEIATSEIRDVILRELKNREPSVLEAWHAYDRAKGVS